MNLQKQSAIRSVYDSEVASEKASSTVGEVAKSSCPGAWHLI
jgi:hypothetical protein